MTSSPGFTKARRGIHAGLCAVGGGDLGGLIVQTAVLLQPLTDSTAQLQRANGRGVLSVVILDRLNTGILDVVRGGKVGLAGAEAYNVLPFRLHLLEHTVDGQSCRRIDVKCNVG